MCFLSLGYMNNGYATDQIEKQQPANKNNLLFSSFNSLLNVVGNFKIMDNPRVFKPHNYLWPIPQAEIDVNKNPGFKQNTGY